jgi:hypothetical protein
MRINARFLLALKVNIALDPGAKVRGVPDHVVLGLAGLDTAQATDALGGVDTVCPAILCPVVVRCRE